MSPSRLAPVLLALAACSVQASPVGVWKTVDDATGQERSLVRIVETDGVLSGRIEKLLIVPAVPHCVKCSDERKGLALEGLEILRNVRPSSEGVWEGGDILDPKSGEVYRVRLKELKGGRALEVRGYVGVPLLGRSQTWQRMD